MAGREERKKGNGKPKCVSFGLGFVLHYFSHLVLSQLRPEAGDRRRHSRALCGNVGPSPGSDPPDVASLSQMSGQSLSFSTREGNVTRGPWKAFHLRDFPRSSAAAAPWERSDVACEGVDGHPPLLAIPKHRRSSRE